MKYVGGLALNVSWRLATLYQTTARTLYPHVELPAHILDLIVLLQDVVDLFASRLSDAESISYIRAYRKVHQ